MAEVLALFGSTPLIQKSGQVNEAGLKKVDDYNAKLKSEEDAKLKEVEDRKKKEELEASNVANSAMAQLIGSKKKGSKSRTPSLLTSPLGLTNQADTVYKTILGG